MLLWTWWLSLNILISPLHIILNSGKYFSNMDSYIEFVMFSLNKWSVHFQLEENASNWRSFIEINLKLMLNIFDTFIRIFRLLVNNLQIHQICVFYLILTFFKTSDFIIFLIIYVDFDTEQIKVSLLIW